MMKGFKAILRHGEGGEIKTDRKKNSGQFITTSAEVTPNGGLVREIPPKMALN